MITLDSQQEAARDWFESLRDRICAEFEAIERESGSDASFEYIPWDRTDERLCLEREIGKITARQSLARISVPGRAWDGGFHE